MPLGAAVELYKANRIDCTLLPAARTSHSPPPTATVNEPPSEPLDQQPLISFRSLTAACATAAINNNKTNIAAVQDLFGNAE